MENKKILCRSQWRRNEKICRQFRAKKHEKKYTKYKGTIYVRSALRNYSEGYKINKLLSGLLVYRMIMSSAERLSSKFHGCPRSFTFRPTQSVFRTTFQPWALSSDIPAAERGLFTKYWYRCIVFPCGTILCTLRYCAIITTTNNNDMMTGKDLFQGRN